MWQVCVSWLARATHAKDLHKHIWQGSKDIQQHKLSCDHVMLRVEHSAELDCDLL
jgi:hypothetical protein